MGRSPSILDLAAGTTLGTPTGYLVVASGGAQGEGFRTFFAQASGEVEWQLVIAGTQYAAWLQPASTRPQRIQVPGGSILRARRPGATSRLGAIALVVTEGEE